jgi:hypothetical protein
MKIITGQPVFQSSSRGVIKRLHLQVHHSAVKVAADRTIVPAISCSVQDRRPVSRRGYMIYMS